MPILHVIAGPNGAGKTTFYHNRLKPFLGDAEFVNADELALAHYGHVAGTLEESFKGQELAENRRRQLLNVHADFVMESTFSHESKLDLIKDAVSRGYEVFLHHVNVRSPELSVHRVAHRVGRGGHPVPEDKVRGRYERNGPLIRLAAKLATRAYVYDNSGLGTPPQLLFILSGNEVTLEVEQLPDWAAELYADELTESAQPTGNGPGRGR